MANVILRYPVLFLVFIFVISTQCGGTVGSGGESDVSHNATDNSTHGEAHDERYHIAAFDFTRVQTPLVVSLWLLLAVITKILFHMSHTLEETIPESCVLMMLGLVCGGILWGCGVNYEIHPDIFFLYFLPPIIMDAGYHMPNRAFFDNIGSILLFAVLGTLFNTITIGFSIWGLTESGGVGAIPLQVDMLHCLTLAALLSAVDPVAVIAVFEEVHVHDILYIVVFGESLLNDGVAVVLYHVFEGFSHIGAANILPIDIVFGFISFFVVAGGATLIGACLGLLAGFITRFTKHFRVVEPIIAFVIGYASYLIAEMFHLSGILSCTFCGIVMNKYICANVSAKSRTTIKYFMKMAANAAEGVLFLFLGIEAVSKNHEWDTAFVLLTVLFCLIFRAIMVVSFCFFLNPLRADKLTPREQFIMAYSGLRGGIAFFLAMSLSADIFPQRKLFITTTIVVVYFTVIILGATVKPIVNLLKVKRKEAHRQTMNEKIHSRTVDHIMSGIEDIVCNYGHQWLRERYAIFDRKVLKKILVREPDKKKSGVSILSTFKKLAEDDITAFVEHGGTKSFGSSLFLSPSFASLYRGTSVASDNTLHTSVSVSSDTRLDLSVSDMQDSKKMRDEAKMHHVLDDALYQPRRRLVVDTNKLETMEAEQQPVFHHQMRHRIRTSLGHRDHALPSHFPPNTHHSKNVYFVNQNGAVVPDEADEDGITFTVPQSAKDVEQGQSKAVDTWSHEKQKNEAGSRSPPAYTDAHTHPAVSHSSKPASDSSSKPASEECDGTRRRTFSREQGADDAQLQDTGPSVTVRSSKSSQRHYNATDSDSKL